MKKYEIKFRNGDVMHAEAEDIVSLVFIEAVCEIKDIISITEIAE